MNKKIDHQYIHYISLLLIVATLPYAVLLNSYLIILMSANWLLTGQFKSKFYQLRQNKTALLLISFYLFYCVGLLYSRNVPNGLTDLEHKLSLFVFPFVLSTSSSLTTQQFQNLLKTFVLSCTATMVICLGYAAAHYSQHRDLSYFFYHRLGDAISMHAVYFSMYLLFCLFIVIYFLIPQWYTISRQKKLLCALWFLFTLAFIMLLASKVIIISIFLFGNIFLLLFFSIRQRLLKGIVLVGVLNLALGLSITQLPPVKERFLDSIHTEMSLVNEKIYTPITPFTGISLRLTLWKFSFELLSEHHAWILGIGTGGSQQLLDTMYQKHNMYIGVEGTTDRGFLGYNSHSQYVGTLLSLGVIGLVLLLIYLFWPALYAWKHQNYLHIAFILLFAITSLTESTLGTQKGTVFFALFHSLFTFSGIGSPHPLKSPDTPRS